MPRERKDCQVEASTGGWVSSKLTCAVLCSAYTVAVCAYNCIHISMYVRTYVCITVFQTIAVVSLHRPMYWCKTQSTLPLPLCRIPLVSSTFMASLRCPAGAHAVRLQKRI